MKKILLYLITFIIIHSCSVDFDQLPTADNYWVSGYKIVGSDTLLIDSLTSNGNPEWVVTFCADQLANIDSGYIDLLSHCRLGGQAVNTLPRMSANDADTTWYEISDIAINSDSTRLLPLRLESIWHSNTPQVGQDKIDLDIAFNSLSVSNKIFVPDDYATITLAVAGVSIGDTILVKDGFYIEDKFGRFIVDKQDVKVIGIGFVQVQGITAGIEMCRLNASGAEMNGLEFISNSSTYILRNQTANTFVKNCYISSFSTGAVLMGNSNFNVGNCVFKNSTSTSTVYSALFGMNSTNNYYDVNISTYVWGSATQNDNIIISKYDKFKLVGTERITQAACKRFELKYCDYFAASQNAVIVQPLSTVRTSFVTIKGCNFEVDTMITSGWLLLENTVTTAFVNIENTTFKNNATLNPTFLKKQGKGIIIDGLITDMDYSSLDISECDSFITIQNSSLTWKNPLNNDVSILAINTADIGNTSPILVENNKIKGGYSFGSDNGGHGGVLIRSYSNFNIKHNNISGMDIGSIIVKMTGVFSSYGSAICGNISDSCGIINRGHDSLLISNNTINKIQNIGSPYGINLYEGDDQNEATYNFIYNNIMNDCKYNYRVVNFSDGSVADLNHTFDNNIVYGDTVAILNDLYTITSWTAWQDSINGELNSFNTNPNLDVNLVPQYKSDAIGNALNLGTPYDTALNISSVWPDSVIKKQQFARWSIGTYIPEIDTLDNYASDTTMGIWSNTFNQAKWIYNNSTDTIIIGVDNFETWSIKENEFIDLVGNDSIIYGTDNFETWRTKFNNSADSANAE